MSEIGTQGARLDSVSFAHKREEAKSRRATMWATTLTTLYLVAFATVGWLAWSGRAYYATALVDRPHHPLHWALKPGGSRGLALGITGASMMVVMMAYPLRKRIGFLANFGRLSLWLDIHIFLGIVGPLLIVLHTSFKVQGLVAVAFWSMIAVALSGFLGRFLYLQLPRTAAGDELTLAEALDLDAELTESLRQQFRLTPEEIAELETLASAGFGADQSLAAVLLQLPLARLSFRVRLARFRHHIRRVPAPLLARFAQVARQKALLRQRLALWGRLRELFHYWHVIHKPFAVLLYLFMTVHVVVAWMTGYAGGLR